MNRVKVFNWMWFYIIRFMVPVLGRGIQGNRLRMNVQWALAGVFGGVGGIIFGDSNGAVLNNYKTMSKFNRIILNWSTPGTTAHDWYYFFITPIGKKIRIRIWKNKHIINIGGNYVLLGLMASADEGLRWLRTWFPTSFNCTIPPINNVMLAKLCKLLKIKDQRIDPEYLRESVLQINKTIKKYWGKQTIDLYKMFGDKDGKTLPFALKDVVHYSDVAVALIQKVFDVVI